MCYGPSKIKCGCCAELRKDVSSREPRPVSLPYPHYVVFQGVRGSRICYTREMREKHRGLQDHGSGLVVREPSEHLGFGRISFQLLAPPNPPYPPPLSSPALSPSSWGCPPPNHIRTALGPLEPRSGRNGCRMSSMSERHGLVQMAASGWAPCVLPHDSPLVLPFPPSTSQNVARGGLPPYSRGVHLGLPSSAGILEAGELMRMLS